MCIRDRVGSLAQARAWQAAHPQEKLEERDLAGHALLPGFIDPPVSYTHLDVYKRQGQSGVAARDYP